MAILRPHVADYRLAAFMNVNMFDADILSRAVPPAPENLNLHRISLQ